MSDKLRHPFLTGLSKHRGAPATALVIFGASGDLTRRKLIPAVYNLCVDNLLPSDFCLVGFGRKAIADDDFRTEASASIRTFSRRPMAEELWSRVAQRTFYHCGDYDDPEAYHALARRLQALEKEMGRELQLLFYVSTPPEVFKPIVANLGASGLASQRLGTDMETKVVIEKPFGRDLASANDLNALMRVHLRERQIYRIDHYLGKETVQDLLVERFANAIFEPLWNRNYVDCVQITVAEELGVGSRAGYYDGSGALRDMIQNHTMQLLSLVAMEPPVSLDPEAIRDEKVKLLKAVQPLEIRPGGGDVVRGQYKGGLVHGERVPAYAEEPGVPEGSFTETYAALRLRIDNWRWNGVPFYLRSGKRLARRVSEIAIQFKRPPGILFSDTTRFDLTPNTLVFQIQPDEGTTLLVNSKIPGLETRTQPVKMHFRYATTFGSNTPEAYERLILDAMIADSTLFIRGDETEASWRLITPILEFWNHCGLRGLEDYVAGSWGPLAAEKMLWENHHAWRRPGP